MTTEPITSVVILDTDVFSLIYKNRAEAAPYLHHLQDAVPAITFVTMAELYRRAYQRNWSARNISRLGDRIHKFLILPYDESVAQRWARIQTAIPGRIFPANDAWIAACAITFGCTLLTHNPKDFEDVPGLTSVTYAE